MEKYILPPLPYEYNALEPVISGELLKIHHDKHHAAYVNAANILLAKMREVRMGIGEIDQKSALKGLSFSAGGHILHKLFWENMSPVGSGKNKPSGKILELIEKEFGSFEKFKIEFSETAKSVEGSGWAVLAFDKELDALSVIQIEKHNVNLYSGQEILLVLDAWEHAYYLDYKNERPKFIEAWWDITNWEEVEKRFKN